MEDKNSGQLFAEAPITEFPTKSIEPVSDSSRYFVLKIENQGRSAFIGVGFADRSDSFDFNVALQVRNTVLGWVQLTLFLGSFQMGKKCR